MKKINILANEFLSAFFGIDDDICFRIFSDRKDDDEDYRGNKYTEKLKNIDSLLPTLQQHNTKNRGIFFVINSGGHSDENICRVNAQFTESDTLSFEEQMERIDSFPLPPSIIVKTKKSLHTYWLMQDGEVARFRELQLGLAKHFDGDTQCQNESRVLRLPGFNHCKNEPVEVECIKFEPNLKYTQAQLAEHLPEIEMPTAPVTDANTTFEGKVGSGQRLLDNCAFCQYCRDNAKTLSEPVWYAFISNMALSKDGATIVHEISKPYPKYNKAETDEKICHALIENKPHTCAYIQNRLEFKGCGDCKVKSPIVHAVLTLAEQVAELLLSEITEDLIFDSKTIELMGYAKNNLPAEYGKFKMKIKGKVSMRDFENAVKHKEKSRDFATVEDIEMPLNLPGINIPGAVQPPNWDVSIEKGVRKIQHSRDGVNVVTACPSPVVISKRFENVDNESEKVELSFYRNHRWKRFTAPRSAVFNKSVLVSYGDSGLPVTSLSATDLVIYLSDYENANINTIPLMKSTERLGWIGDDSFFPYTAPQDVCFETDYRETDEIYSNLKEHGSYEVWKVAASKIRENPFSRFLIAASFASPLLEKLNHRVFLVNIWHDTKSGKTAVIKLATAVWGNPVKIMGSFNATAVGMERRADTLRHIVFALDERQLVNEKRLSIGQIVYGLANGFGKIRGNKEGGIQDVTSWRNIILSSGEEPLAGEDTHDGINTRVMELHGQPVLQDEYAKELHIISEKNYGFAGREFIEYLCSLIRRDKKSVQSDYEQIYVSLKERCFGAKHLENAAVVCLGDYYADICIWKNDKASALKMAVEMGVAMLGNNIQHEKEDIILRAWQYVCDWCVANDKAFANDAPVRFGIKENESTYYVLKFALDDALQKKNYPVEKCKTGFFERGYMAQWNGKRQKQKKVGGVTNWYYVINVSDDYCTGDAMPLV